MSFLGVTFVSLWLFVGFSLWNYMGLWSYIIFFFLIGSVGIVIFVNCHIVGLIFVRKKCMACKFSKLILDHEVVHLNSDVSEEEVWGILKKVYTAENLSVYDDEDICGFCPIPSRLVEE